MATASAIQWTDATWNPLAGCSEISPGCTNCYAATMARRLEAMGQAKYKGTTRQAPSGKTVWTGKINLAPGALTEPLLWKKPRRVFVNSMSDLMHEDVPDHFIAAVFGVMAACKQHTFQVLTKRSDRLPGIMSLLGNDIDICGLTCGYLDQIGFERGCGSAFDPDDWPPPNVWLGVSCEDQARAVRLNDLRDSPAAIRFVSAEPLLSELIVKPWLDHCPCGRTGFAAPEMHAPGCHRGPCIDWLIIGCESGPKRRPMKDEWARSLIDQCRAARVSVFMKQMEVDGKVTGDIDRFPEWARVRQFPKATVPQ